MFSLRLLAPRDRHFGEYPDSGPPRQVVAASLYGPRFSARPSSTSSRRPRQGLGPRLRRGPMAEALDEPLGVVARDELADDPSRLLEALELVQVDALLLERAHEALGDPVAFGFADVRRRNRAAEPLHLVDPGVGDVLRAPVAADRQAPRHVFAEPPEGMADALPNGLEGGPAIAELGRVPADDFVEMVIEGAEEPAPAVTLGIEARRIGPPHHVWSIRGDRPVVGRVAIRGSQAPRGQQPVRAHQPEHALATDRPAAMGEARAHLAIAFAMKGTRGQHGLDFLHEIPVAHSRLGPALSRRPQRWRRGGRIDRRAGEPINRTDHGQGIAAPRARTALLLHPLRLLHSSVKPLFSMRSSASSRRIINSPLFARASISSRSSGSAFVRSPRLPCSRKIRCQRSSSCAGTWLSRDTASKASPRSNRNTNSIFRCTLQRSGRSSAVAPGVGSVPPGCHRRPRRADGFGRVCGLTKCGEPPPVRGTTRGGKDRAPDRSNSRPGNPGSHNPETLFILLEF